MPTPRTRIATNPANPAPRVPLEELLIVHQALEGWIARQHQRTREELHSAITKEAMTTKREIAALRAEVRKLARRQAR